MPDSSCCDIDLVTVLYFVPGTLYSIFNSIQYFITDSAICELHIHT